MAMADAAGMKLRYDGAILWKEDAPFLRIAPRYGRTKRKTRADSRKSLRRIRRILWLARTGRMECAMLHARIGLNDASQTALAAGALRALACAALLSCAGGARRELRVTADYDAVCFAAYGRCIFSCQAGDIMLAVLKAAVKKIGKEGFGWKSTPLKA